MLTIPRCEFIKAEKDGSLLVVSLAHYSMPGKEIRAAIEAASLDQETRASIENNALDGRRFTVVCADVHHVSPTTIAAIDVSALRLTEEWLVRA